MFPRFHHAHRTAGFFKVRGVNINHAEFEGFLFANVRVNDFKAEVVATADGNDALQLSIEVPRSADGGEVAKQVAGEIKVKFEVTPGVTVLEIGTLAKEFETSVKAPRFVDRRE